MQQGERSWCGGGGGVRGLGAGEEVLVQGEAMVQGRGRGDERSWCRWGGVRGLGAGGG